MCSPFLFVATVVLLQSKNVKNCIIIGVPCPVELRAWLMTATINAGMFGKYFNEGENKYEKNSSSGCDEWIANGTSGCRR
jgi:hypothetical protein